MQESRVIYICGPHCSGKSSILKKLYEDKILTEWGPEIGKELYYQRRLDTEAQGEKFELEVSALEQERDRDYLNKNEVIGIETWHPGNLAYAAVRNPEIVPALIQNMKKSPLIHKAYGIRFTISPETIAKRTKTFQDNREWATHFYKKIDSELDSCIKQLDLQDRTITIDANREFDEVLSEVKETIKQLLDRE